MDRISLEQRSRLMARVRGCDTGIEIRLRRLIWKIGFRYRKNHRVEGVKTDLAFPRARLVVFVDGCFWHGCALHYSMPKSRVEFWAEKIRMNVDRDRRQTLKLEERGWTVIRVWEHAVKSDPESVALEIADVIRSDRKPMKKKDWRVVRVGWSKGAKLAVWYLEDLRNGSLRKIEKKEVGVGRNCTVPPKAHMSAVTKMN